MQDHEGTDGVGPNPTSKIHQGIEASFRGSALRSVSIEGKVWFVAMDICKTLSLADPSTMLRQLELSEKRTAKIRTAKGYRTLAVVNESALYHLISKSEKPEAVAFRLWVTDEILPSLRRGATGEAQATKTGDAYLRVPGPGEFHVSLTMDGHLSIVPDESRIKDYQILELEALAHAFLLIGTLWRKFQLLDSVAAHTGEGSNTRYQLGVAIKQAEHIAASATRTRIEMLGELDQLTQ